MRSPPLVRDPARSGGRGERAVSFLRWNPEVLVVPGLIVWFWVNTDSGLIGLNLVRDLVATALLRSGHTNAITVLTYPLALVSVVIAWWLLRPLGWWRAGLVALTVPFGWLMTFEVPWHVIGWFSPGYPFPVNEQGWIILASWSALGALSFPCWRVNRWFGAALAAFVLLWGGWLAVGYPQLPSGDVVALAFNFALKAGAFVTFMLLLWPHNSLSDRAPPPAVPEPGPPSHLGRTPRSDRAAGNSPADSEIDARSVRARRYTEVVGVEGQGRRSISSSRRRTCGHSDARML
jgi:hypothetical protein